MLYILSGKAFATRVLLMFLGVDVGTSAVKAVFFDGLKLSHPSPKRLLPSRLAAEGRNGMRNVGGKPVVASCAAPSLAFAKLGDGKTVARLRNRSC